MNLKSPEDIAIMKEGGKITGRVLSRACDLAVPGTTLAEIDYQADKMIRDAGATPSFKEVPGYDYATCINVNEGVVHGVPSSYEIQAGDLVSIDLGAFYKGFHTDSAHTVVAGGATAAQEAFLAVGQRALHKAIAACVAGGTMKAVSHAMQSTVEGAGLTISRDLVGHGVGRELHEEPEVPGYTGTASDAVRLQEGLVLAVEVIYMQGGDPIVVDPSDRWTIQTKDGSIAALFEHSVAITADGPVVLTVHGNTR